jgi:hypothetical protein
MDKEKAALSLPGSQNAICTHQEKAKHQIPDRIFLGTAALKQCPKGWKHRPLTQAHVLRNSLIRHECSHRVLRHLHVLLDSGPGSLLLSFNCFLECVVEEALRERVVSVFSVEAPDSRAPRYSASCSSCDAVKRAQTGNLMLLQERTRLENPPRWIMSRPGARRSSRARTPDVQATTQFVACHSGDGPWRTISAPIGSWAGSRVP